MNVWVQGHGLEIAKKKRLNKDSQQKHYGEYKAKHIVPDLNKAMCCGKTTLATSFFGSNWHKMNRHNIHDKH